MNSNNRSSKTTILYALHGWALGPGNEEKWQVFRQACQPRGVTVKLLSIPGLDSSLPEMWTMGEYVQWLSQELPTEPCYLLGHSFGGQLSLVFAHAYPKKIKSLVLIDSAGIRDHRIKMKLKRSVFSALAKVGKRVTVSELARTWLYQLTRESDYLQAPPDLRQTMSNVLLHEVDSLLPSVVVPTLILWGDQDKVTPLWMGQKLSQLLPHNEFDIVQGARHSPHFTHSQVVAEKIVRWLEKTRT